MPAGPSPLPLPFLGIGGPQFNVPTQRTREPLDESAHHLARTYTIPPSITSPNLVAIGRESEEQQTFLSGNGQMDRSREPLGGVAQNSYSLQPHHSSSPLPNLEAIHRRSPEESAIEIGTPWAQPLTPPHPPESTSPSADDAADAVRAWPTVSGPPGQLSAKSGTLGPSNTASVRTGAQEPLVPGSGGDRTGPLQLPVHSCRHTDGPPMLQEDSDEPIAPPAGTTFARRSESNLATSERRESYGAFSTTSTEGVLVAAARLPLVGPDGLTTKGKAADADNSSRHDFVVWEAQFFKKYRKACVCPSCGENNFTSSGTGGQTQQKGYSYLQIACKPCNGKKRYFKEILKDSKGQEWLWAQWRAKDEEFGVIPAPRKRTAVRPKQSKVVNPDEQLSIRGFFQPAPAEDTTGRKRARRVSDVSGGKDMSIIPTAPKDMSIEAGVDMAPMEEDEDDDEVMEILGGAALPAHAPPPVSLATHSHGKMHILAPVLSASTGPGAGVNMTPMGEDDDEEMEILGGAALPAHAPPPVSLATHAHGKRHILAPVLSASAGPSTIPTTGPNVTGRPTGPRPLPVASSSSCPPPVEVVMDEFDYGAMTPFIQELQRDKALMAGQIEALIREVARLSNLLEERDRAAPRDKGKGKVVQKEQPPPPQRERVLMGPRARNGGAIPANAKGVGGRLVPGLHTQEGAKPAEAHQPVWGDTQMEEGEIPVVQEEGSWQTQTHRQRGGAKDAAPRPTRGWAHPPATRKITPQSTAREQKLRLEKRSQLVEEALQPKERPAEFENVFLILPDPRRILQVPWRDRQGAMRNLTKRLGIARQVSGSSLLPNGTIQLVCMKGYAQMVKTHIPTTGLGVKIATEVDPFAPPQYTRQTPEESAKLTGRRLADLCWSSKSRNFQETVLKGAPTGVRETALTEYRKLTRMPWAQLGHVGRGYEWSTDVQMAPADTANTTTTESLQGAQ